MRKRVALIFLAAVCMADEQPRAKITEADKLAVIHAYSIEQKAFGVLLQTPQYAAWGEAQRARIAKGQEVFQRTGCMLDLETLACSNPQKADNK